MPAVPADVLAFHRECLVLDLHVDTLLWTRLVGYDFAVAHRNRLPRAPLGWHVDLPRAREGGLRAAVLGLVVNPREVRRELILPLKLLARIERGAGIEQTLATLALWEAAERAHPEALAFARSGSEIRRAVAQGRFAGLACLEGSHGLEGRIENLRRAHARGLRMVGLVHFQATEAARPMTVAAFDGQGLTMFGHELLGEIESLHMAVDLAHLNAAGIDDVLAHARRPCVVSHTACRALRDHPRNLGDEQIRRVAEAGGVVGVAVGAIFLGNGTLERFLDHVEHLLRVGGADVPALGSDWDGFIVPVRGMEDVRCLPQITAGLLARGHSHETVRKLLGENALRVLTEVCG